LIFLSKTKITTAIKIIAVTTINNTKAFFFFCMYTGKNLAGEISSVKQRIPNFEADKNRTWNGQNADHKPDQNLTGNERQYFSRL
jgi:hypothetical protein